MIVKNNNNNKKRCSICKNKNSFPTFASKKPTFD